MQEEFGDNIKKLSLVNACNNEAFSIENPAL